MIKKYNKLIGENIRNLRKSKCLSVKEFADMLKLSVSYVGLLERGQRGVKIDILIKISDIFDITLDELCINRLSQRGKDDFVPNIALLERYLTPFDKETIFGLTKYFAKKMVIMN